MNMDMNPDITYVIKEVKVKQHKRSSFLHVPHVAPPPLDGVEG